MKRTARPHEYGSEAVVLSDESIFEGERRLLEICHYQADLFITVTINL